MNSYKVILIDDHPVVREGLSTILKYRDSEIQVLDAVGNGRDGAELVKRKKPDVVLLDVIMPEMNGIETAKLILSENPDQKIIMLTSFHEKDLIQEALDAGAKGYLLKDSLPDNIIQSIKLVAQGHFMLSEGVAESLLSSKPDDKERTGDFIYTKLTMREKEILTLVAEGLSNSEIGEKLFISEKTVRNYISKIYDLVGEHSRSGLTVWAIRNRDRYLG